MVGWYDNPIPTQFLAPLEYWKIPAQTQTTQETVSKMQPPSIYHVAAETFLRECPFIHLHPKWHAPRLAWEKMGKNWETVGGKRGNLLFVWHEVRGVTRHSANPPPPTPQRWKVVTPLGDWKMMYAFVNIFPKLSTYEYVHCIQG